MSKDEKRAVSDEITRLVAELTFMMGVLEKVPDASVLAAHCRELLSFELQQDRPARKTYLNGMKKELLVVARETMGAKSWASFKAILARDALFEETYLHKIRNEGVIRDEDEYRKVLIELDLLINGDEGASLAPEQVRLVTDVNALLARSPFFQVRD
ncbi:MULTISPECIES: hypothetical protein [Herbaspirillum]|uniref:Uncharacterized protein n=1 Tax=Herbaspirillum huttiense subsp. lycopersici TaxID=3074428 RepID=A0ABU2ESI3_9BURK|nr:MULTISPECIES: hypothetical protein [Herbaspirillum]MDR6739769.1 hypothetical protein [Herbaspirillum sp. 1173]MDR9850718.1 hypothetical protein [Herbaspirillum huttiense SE1]